MIRVLPILGSIDVVTNTKLCTVLATYPRSIHAQLLTHRKLSKNSSSSRAIPVMTEITNINNDPVEIFWTKNEKGMQGQRIVDEVLIEELNNLVLEHREQAFELAKKLADPDGYNIHKQNVNRFLEPFANITVLITATDWLNFEWLRMDSAAQGEIETLASLINAAREEMPYTSLYQGEYHLPFVDRMRDEDGVMRYYQAGTEIELSLEDAIKVSASCNAQTSYRRLDDSLEKAESMQTKLRSGEKLHASPYEHIATPIQIPMHVYKDLPLSIVMEKLPAGVTAIDRKLNLWSGNLRNWIQYRHLLPNNDYDLV